MITSGRRFGLVVAAVVWLGCGASADRYATVRKDAFGGQGASSAVGEPLPPASRVWGDASELSLDAVLLVAETRNPTLAAARASWQAAVERYPQVTALADPTFAYVLAPGTIDSDESIYGQKVEVAQRFPWPGKLALRGEAALDDAQAAEDGFESSRQHLRHSVTEAYYEFWLTHRVIEINHTNQGLLAEFQRIAESRYAAGLASKSDALQAEVEHQHLVHRGIALERDRKVAQARLNTLLNLPPKQRLPSPPLRVAKPSAVAALSRLEPAALEQRPELHALEHTVGARSADVEFAHREYFPNFAVNAGYNSLWEVFDKRTVVGVAIDVPLQLGSRGAAVSEAQAEHRGAQARLEEARAATLLEVSEAYDQLVETEHVVHLYASSILPVARESLSTARVGYESGANDFLTLVESEKSLYLSELTYQQALAAYHQGRARLEFAVGRPLESLEGPEVAR